MQLGGVDQSAQMQMRKMDGSGGGHGKGGMGSVMQSLSTEDKSLLQDQMSTVAPEDKVDLISQLKEVDNTSMSSEEYMDTLISIINDSTTNDDNDTLEVDTTSVEVYA